MASTHLSRTFGTSTNTGIFTMSFWVKRANLGSTGMIAFATFGNNNTKWLQVAFNSDNKFVVSGYSTLWLATNRLFRDTNAWYHIVVQADSPQGTASNRLKIYVNGVEETSFATDNRSSITQSQTWGWNSSGGVVHYIGSEATGNFFDGSLSHFHFADGSIVAPTVFGSTDATTGEWKINTSPSFTLGNNGFTILKDGNTITDQSTNSNNWTLAGGTLTKTEDCPDNVFATLSAIDKYAAGLSNGSTTVTNESNAATIVLSTLAVNSGKWYWEAKVENSTADNFNVGIKQTGQNNYNVTGSAYNSTGWVYATDGNIYHGGSSILNTGTTSTVGDIIGFILDMDAGTLKLKKNGSDIYSGNAVVSSLNTGEHYHVVQGASQSIVSFNFGNGYFGTTAVSSAGTNASGNGIFEYDVPTGFTALSTKGLNL